MDIENRKKQLENLNRFINGSLNKLNSILDFMGWEAEKVIEDKGLIQCSIQPYHRIPKASAETHMKKCVLRQEGYTVDEPFLSEPSVKGPSSIYISNDIKHNLFLHAQKSASAFKRGWNAQIPDPKTSDRLITSYTSDERLTLYDYAVGNTQGISPPPEFNITAPKTDKPLSYEEKLILERNAKRRRTKYRAVHTNKKSYNEVMREVIDGQMKLYEEWIESNEALESKTENVHKNVRSMDESSSYKRSRSNRSEEKWELRKSHKCSSHGQHHRHCKDGSK